MSLMARAGLAGFVCLCLAGCATPNLGGGEAAAPSVATPAAPEPPPPPPPYDGVASGALGGGLSPASRAAANAAELAALNAGDRKSWRGDDGAYGYVAPGASSGDCRDFTHTIYINGRPKLGNGTACKVPGGWKFKS